MPEARAGVLFVDAGEALLPAREALGRRGIESGAIEYVSGSAPPPAGPAPVVAVIGPGVANPAAAARALCSVHPGLHVVFAAEPSRQAALRRTLLYSAPANTPWTLVAPAAQEVAQAVLESLDAARRNIQVRTTLDRVNLRLRTPSLPDARDYRRLLVSDQYLASVLRHVQDAIISLDLGGNILSWNDGATRLFSRGPREVTGKRLEAIAAWSGDLRELLLAAVRTGFVRSELRVEIGGRMVLVDATFSAIQEHPAEVMAVAVILRDITEQKRTEAELAANEARFRAMADNIPQLAWMTDATGAITWYNSRWFEYTGTTLEEMRGWQWQRVHHPDHVERVTEKFRTHIEAQAPWEDTFPLRSRNGDYRWFLSRAFPIRNSAGDVTHWFGTNTDITDEREAQQALREADQRKNDFIGVLSHELRNPLSPIRSSIYLLERLGHDEEAARKARAVISRQVEHLTRLVDDLLDITRIARGKIELVKARADLAAIVRATIEDYRPVVESAGLRLASSLPGKPVYGEVDAARIGQVLGNLLQNAVKFTPAGGDIDVSMALEQGSVRIAVRDSGMGIEPPLLQALFEPFVQGERSLARSQGGLGLGLALARGIVEMHGGHLDAASEGADRGATFTVWLASSDDPGEAAPAPPEGAVAASPVCRVLVVDDNRDAADSLVQLVRLFGHQADVAYDGPSALVNARASRPDLVLCDIGLPGMDGYEVARRLRSEMGVRMVAISGYARAADLQQSAQAGFEEHLAKPPRPEEILRVLRSSPSTCS